MVRCLPSVLRISLPLSIVAWVLSCAFMMPKVPSGEFVDLEQFRRHLRYPAIGGAHMSLPVVIRLVLQADSLGRVVDVVAENGEEEYRQAIKRAVLRSRTSFPQKSTAASAWPRPERDVLFLSHPRAGESIPIR